MEGLREKKKNSSQVALHSLRKYFLDFSFTFRSSLCPVKFTTVRYIRLTLSHRTTLEINLVGIFGTPIFFRSINTWQANGAVPVIS